MAMIQYDMTMTLLSPTIFGNGESVNGLVNTDVLMDKDGYPMLLGKTFKGNLRQVFEDILKPYYQTDKNDEFSKVMRILFGGGGYSATNEGSLIIENFYIDNNSKNYFKKYLPIKEYLPTAEYTQINKLLLVKDKELKKSVVLDALTTIRYATKIEDGVVSGNSLRTYREVNSGLVFTSSVYLDQARLLGLDEAVVNKYLTQGFQALKSIGVNKNKGKGSVQISFELVKPKKELEKDQLILNGQEKLICEWELIEPVKIGDSHRSYDYEKTKGYLTGSAIRGAVIKELLNKNKQNDISDVLKCIDFHNAYPIYTNFLDDDETKWSENIYAFPMPECFQTDKKMKKQLIKKIETPTLTGSGVVSLVKRYTYCDECDASDKGEGVVLEFVSKLENKKSLSENLKSKDFAVFHEDRNMLEQKNVKTHFSFHHSKQLKEENLFRYQYIQQGQRFYSVIEVDKAFRGTKQALMASVGELLKKDMILNLGGSRSSGYGKVKLTSIKTESVELEKLLSAKTEIESKEGNKAFKIYFLSDSIPVNECGEIGSLPEQLSGAKKTGEIFLTTTGATGYNAKWESHISQCQAVKAGSVMILNATDETEVENLMDEHFFYRRQEGYGTYLINPKFLDVKTISTILETFYSDENDCNLDVDVSKVPKAIINKVDESLCAAIVQNYVGRIGRHPLALRENIKSSQWRQLLNEIQLVKVDAKDRPLRRFLEQVIEGRSEIGENQQRNLNNRHLLIAPLFEDLSEGMLDDADKKAIPKFISLQTLYELTKEKPDNLLNIANAICGKYKMLIQNDRTKDFVNKNAELIILNTIHDLIYYDLRGEN